MVRRAIFFVKAVLTGLLVVVLAGGAGAALGDAVFTAVPEKQFLRAFVDIVGGAFLAAVSCIVLLYLLDQCEKWRKRISRRGKL